MSDDVLRLGEATPVISTNPTLDGCEVITVNGATYILASAPRPVAGRELKLLRAARNMFMSNRIRPGDIEKLRVAINEYSQTAPGPSAGPMPGLRSEAPRPEATQEQAEDAYRNGFHDALSAAALRLEAEGRRSAVNRDAIYAQRGAGILRDWRDEMNDHPPAPRRRTAEASVKCICCSAVATHYDPVCIEHAEVSAVPMIPIESVRVVGPVPASAFKPEDFFSPAGRPLLLCGDPGPLDEGCQRATGHDGVHTNWHPTSGGSSSWQNRPRRERAWTVAEVAEIKANAEQMAVDLGIAAPVAVPRAWGCPHFAELWRDCCHLCNPPVESPEAKSARVHAKHVASGIGSSWCNLCIADGTGDDPPPAPNAGVTDTTPIAHYIEEKLRWWKRENSRLSEDARQAFPRGVSHERRRIVAWLREYASEAAQIPGPEQYEDALRNAAEAIESGEEAALSVSKAEENR